MVRKKKNKKGKASYVSDKDRVLSILKDRIGEEYNAKTIANLLQSINKDTRPFKKIYSSVRQSLRRLIDDGNIQSIKHGFYTIPSAEEVDQELKELERRLSDQISMESHKNPDFHNIHFYIKRENCDKMDAPLPDRLKNAFNTLSPTSIYQQFAKRNVTAIRGGVMEKFNYKDRVLCVECYGTGKINLSLNCSQNPLTFSDYLFYEEWLDALLLSITGFGFRELQDLTTVNWEWNNDKEQIERIDASGSYAITVRQFDGMVSRLYLKHFKDGSIKERMEQVVNVEANYADWLRGSSVMFSGGVNTQFLIRQQFEHEKEMETMAKIIEKQANAIILNQKLLQGQGMETAHLQKCMEEMAEQLGVKLTKKKNIYKDTPVKEKEDEN